MADDYGLEAEHEALLRDIVEARRNVKGGERKHFEWLQFPEEYRGKGQLMHDGLPGRKVVVNSAMMDVLLNGPLTRRYGTSGALIYFDVSPEGLRYYETLMEAQGAPVAKVEERMREALLRPEFQKAHRKPYAKWVEAEALLWKADAKDDESKIGLLCVEAATLFVDELVEIHAPPGVPTDRKKSKDRLSAVVKHVRPNLGKAEAEWVDALFAYWSKVVALAQRVKHAADKEGEEIVWDHARRAVYQTLSLMYEMHVLLSSTR